MKNIINFPVVDLDTFFVVSRWLGVVLYNMTSSMNTSIHQFHHLASGCSRVSCDLNGFNQSLVLTISFIQQYLLPMIRVMIV